jgi:hypothetical protein
MIADADRREGTILGATLKSAPRTIDNAVQGKAHDWSQREKSHAG